MAFKYDSFDQITHIANADCCRNRTLYLAFVNNYPCYYSDSHGNRFLGTICERHIKKRFNRALEENELIMNGQIDLRCDSCIGKAKYVRAKTERSCRFFCESCLPDEDLPPKAASKII